MVKSPRNVAYVEGITRKLEQGDLKLRVGVFPIPVQVASMKAGGNVFLMKNLPKSYVASTYKRAP